MIRVRSAASWRRDPARTAADVAEGGGGGVRGREGVDGGPGEGGALVGYVTAASPAGPTQGAADGDRRVGVEWERIYCSAGRRGLEIGLAPADLIRLTGAVTAEIVAG